ncbi:MAG: GNAT family N-acetyltransferase [Sulfitobacter sp.]
MADHIPVIDTPRLRLRAPKTADLPAVTAFFASAQSHSVGGPRDDLGSAMSLNAIFGQWALQGFGSWVIADRDSDAYLGRTGFILAPGWEEPELGWALTAQAQGQGIAAEATRAARSFGAAHLGLDAPISYIRPDNLRSAALAERLGARIEKRLPDFRGKPADVWRHPSEGLAA